MSTASTPQAFLPALRYRFLTPLYDLVVRVTSRDGAVKRLLLDLLALEGEERVLDLGCGTGTLALLLATRFPKATVTGLDADADILELARRKAARRGLNVRFDQGMAQKLPYADASFDLAVSSLLFHHLDTAEKLAAMCEARRVLRPGGRLVVADWGRPSSPVMRLGFYAVQALDGRETTLENLEGRLPRMLATMGFDGVQVNDRLNTPLGTIEFLGGEYRMPRTES